MRQTGATEINRWELNQILEYHSRKQEKTLKNISIAMRIMNIKNSQKKDLKN
jgi:hypothetical protein